MAITIITRGTQHKLTYRHVCKDCRTVFDFQKSDGVDDQFTTLRDPGFRIQCPVCLKHLFLTGLRKAPVTAQPEPAAPEPRRLSTLSSQREINA